MRLVVVSHTPHALEGGQWKGWAATVTELSAVASLFDELVHVAPAGSALNAAMCAYSAGNVRVVGVRPTGGEGWTAKVGILAEWPHYLRVLLRELKNADAVHVRCPCNIGLLALMLLCLKRRPARRWIKYAGNWRPAGREPWSYRFQRWLLRRGWHGGIVTVNGQWQGDPPHVREFFNPSFWEKEMEEARAWGRRKTLQGTLRCAFVGRVEEAKGAGRAVEIVRRLREKGVDAQLDVVGNGPMLGELARAQAPWLRLHGWLQRHQLTRLWRNAHVCLLPSETEGWPKVLSEGMAWGAVPVASAVGSVPQYLSRFGCGAALPAEDVDGFARVLRSYVEYPERWKLESERAMAAAGLFTYEAHVRRVGGILGVSVER